MKKIYFNIISLMMIVISFSSCSDWLDVNPSDEIKEEYLFQTGDGFQTALNVSTVRWLLSVFMVVI